jgi:hypothetical protein
MSRGFSKHFANLAKQPAIVLETGAHPSNAVGKHCVAEKMGYDFHHNLYWSVRTKQMEHPRSCVMCEHEKKNSPEARYDRAMSVIDA